MASVVQAGDRVPSVPVKLIDSTGITNTTSDEVLGHGRVVFFAVPGAFTPTCHVHHLPGFLANAPKLRAAGVDHIVCGAVNDHHVLKAWATETGALGAIDFLADGNAALANALGLGTDMSASGMGTRFVRSAMLLEDGVVKSIFAEEKAGQVTGSGAASILLALEALPA
jgi:peroxiredoxin